MIALKFFESKKKKKKKVSCDQTFDIADPEGIANAQKSLGIGQEEKARRVH